MDQAKAAIGTVELPTGLRLESGVVKKIVFRELAGPEEDIMASNLKGSEKLATIMANCTVSIGDLSDRTKFQSVLKKMVESDRWYYLVQIRMLSLGNIYRFKQKCPQCGEEDRLNYDLNQIVVKNAPSADKLFLEITVPSGHQIRWHVLDSEIGEKIEKMSTSNNAATAALYCRVTEFDGKPVVYSDIQQLSLRDRAALRKQIEENEGTFDDEFDAICNKCGHGYRAGLELEGASFFSL